MHNSKKKRSSKRSLYDDYEDENPLETSFVAVKNEDCANCVRIKTFFEEQFEQFTEIMQCHNTTIMDAIGELKELMTKGKKGGKTKVEVKKSPLHSRSRSRSGSRSSLSSLPLPKPRPKVQTNPRGRPRLMSPPPMNSDILPLCTDKDLEKINTDITQNNRQEYITDIRNCLGKHIIRNFENVLSIEIVSRYNVDGTHGKKPLKQYRNFISVLIEAIELIDPECNGLMEIRKAIQIVKKKTYKLASARRKSSAILQYEGKNETI